MKKFKYGQTRNLRKTGISLLALVLIICASEFLIAETHAYPVVAKRFKNKSNSKGVPSPGRTKGYLPEVIIKGGEKAGVQSEKPPLDIEMDPEEPVLATMEIEEEPLKRQPESLRNPRAGFAPSLSNPEAILPGRIRLARAPVKVFYPLREILAISPSLFQEIGTGWEMVITDTNGRPFRTFTGRGLPPGSLAWNGRSNKGRMVKVGKTFSFVISYKDTRGQGRNFVGEPFTFDGVIHQESKGLVISLALSSLFEPKTSYGNEEIIGESGYDLLKETADWIKRYYFTLPVRVDCYSTNPDMATARAQVVANTLNKILLLPRPEISASGYSSEVNNQRLEVVITNR